MESYQQNVEDIRILGEDKQCGEPAEIEVNMELYKQTNRETN